MEPQSDTCDMEAAYAAARQIFGVGCRGPGRPLRQDRGGHCGLPRPIWRMPLPAPRSFKVESKRADKAFPMNSIQISARRWAASWPELFPNVAVDVHHPDLTVYVEIRETAAYVTPLRPRRRRTARGHGRQAVSLLSGGIDSPVSSWMMARRGVELEMVHFVPRPTPPSRPRTRCWSWPGC